MKKKELFKDLSDEQAEKVVGGVGRVFDDGSPAGAGVNGWGVDDTPSAGHGLKGAAGFMTPPPENSNSFVTVKVPGSKGG